MTIDPNKHIIDKITIAPDGSWMVGAEVNDDQTICIRINNRSMCITKEQAVAVAAKLSVALQEWDRLFGSVDHK